MPFVVNNTSFPDFLDLLAPHSCRGCGTLGSPLCPRCKNYIISVHHHVCPACKSPQAVIGHCTNCPNLPPIYAVGPREGILDQIIRDYKYQSIRALATILTDLLDHTLPILPQNTVIVPLPTASHHIRSRGFDHTALLARRLARSRHFTIRPLLIRTRNTVQVGTDKHTRLAQATSAYQLNPKIHLDTTTPYLLLDDIWTTGATIKAATKILRTNGAEDIQVAVLAYST